MRRGVAVRRAVATADMAALEADPQVKPLPAGGEAVLTPIDGLGKLGDPHVVEVGAGSHLRGSYVPSARTRTSLPQIPARQANAI